jgi:uncharacterized RDD family membrane protein YckC
VDVVGPVGLTTITARQSELAERLISVALAESIGVVFFLLGSLALWPPRAPRGEAPIEAASVSPSPEVTDAVGRPVSRFMARAIDWGLFGLVSAFVAPPGRALVLFLWLPIEAFLLSRWGFTPGKWLLRIAVRDAQGRRPSFRSAFRRAAVVWAYGAGADTPFALATGVLAYADLKHNRTTYWDTLGGTIVQHRPVGVGRAVTAVVVFLGTMVAASLVASTR